MKFTTISQSIAALTFSFVCISCVQPPTWSTASGSPEVIIKGSDAQGKVVGRMVAKQWEITNQTNNSMTFERQQLSAGNKVFFAIAGDTIGIIDSWNLAFIPSGEGTRVCLTSTYVKTRDYGKTVNPATDKAGHEFMSTLNGL
jgi:hypothetical protein